MKYRLKITDEENKKEINVSEDEIMEVKYKIGLAEDTNLANSRSTVEMEIIGKIISNLENIGNNLENESINDDLYEKNKKNIIDLVEWAESYLEKSDYRNLEMFVDLGSNKKMDLKFTNMFVYNFSQEMSIEKGIGIFKLKLRQKFHQKNKLDIV